MKSTLKIVFFVVLSHCAMNEETEKLIKHETAEYDGPWGRLLMEYSLRKPQRKSKVLQAAELYIPNSGILITQRVGDASKLESHPRRDLVSAANNALRQIPHGNENSRHIREVTETDLYLLGAIEKLVYRVDYLEHRVRRAEQLLHYLMAENNQGEEITPCAGNFTRIAENCYLVSDIDQLNWKSADNICKSLESHLAEFENVSEFEKVVSYLSNNMKLRYVDLWLGGLNPGLLWIWSNSARPVNPDTNLTFVASTLNPNSSKKSEKTDNKILKNIEEIQGDGRCLKLAYDVQKQAYTYFGEECTSRKFFICEFAGEPDKNNIKKITKSLFS